MRSRSVSTRDCGVGLVELLLTMALTVLCLLVTVTALVQVRRGAATTASSADAMADLRAAAQRIDRVVRSAALVDDPADEVSRDPLCRSVQPRAGTCLRALTLLDGEPRCVQWQVVTLGGRSVLRTRTYASPWTGSADSAAPWSLVADPVPALRGADVFTLVPGSSTAGVVLTVRLGGDANGSATLFDVAPRNAVPGAPVSSCFPGPPA